MAEYSLYTQSGARLKKLFLNSDRVKYSSYEAAVLAAVGYLSNPRKWGWKNKSVLDLNPAAQVIILEYSGPYTCKIVGIVGAETVKFHQIKLQEKPEEKEEKNFKKLSKENLEKFREKFCRTCGSQRCTGTGEWLISCNNFKETFGEISEEDLEKIL